MEIFCFIAGIAFIYLNAIVSVLFLVVCLWFRLKYIFILYFLAGLCLAVFHNHRLSANNWLSDTLLSRACLEGRIKTVSENNHKLQIILEGNKLNSQHFRGLVQLNCYQHCPSVKLGEEWRLWVSMRRPMGFRNPGSFDYQSWLAARHIYWTGSIKKGPHHCLHAPPTFSLHQFRYWLAQKLSQQGLDPEVAAILKALILGLTQEIHKEQWDLFRKTGTTHLMVISGAHIGFIAGIGLWLMQALWRYFPLLCLHIPAIRFGAMAGFLCAGIYTMLAGWGIPAQRAFILCFFMMLRYLLSHTYSAWQAWRYALLVVLIIEPHALFSPGFYLSFLAVAILMVSGQRLPNHKLKKMLGVQLGCLLGLLPFTLYWFSYGSLNGFFANIVAIPWIGFVVLPLGFCILFVSIFGTIRPLTWLTNHAVTYFLIFLEKINHFDFINIQAHWTQAWTPFACLIVLALWICLPIKSVLIPSGILLLSALLPKSLSVKKGEALINVLDVGQGLAVAIHTQHHHLLYDTGGKWLSGADMGQLVVIPYLQTNGVKQLDAVVISHHDLDHVGGLSSLQHQIPITELLVGDVSQYQESTNCHHYSSWQWDNVQFRFLPIEGRYWSKNNHSCVLQISTAKQTILLTGDIEQPAERALIQRYQARLKSDFLLVPHHGSKTSSSLSFLNMVHPQYALFSYGLNNPYHHPNKQIVQKYRQKAIKLYNTADCGMISIQLGNGALHKPNCYKERW